MKHSIPFRLIRFNNQGNHILVVANVASYKMNLIIDTGATLTVFDKERFQRVMPHKQIKPYNKFFMGIGSSRIETFCSHIEYLELNSAVLSNIGVVLIDLSIVNKAYAMFDQPRVDGVLGGDILEKHKAIIDYKENHIHLHL